MASLALSPESIFNIPNFQEAINDTPDFRANIRKAEEQVDYFEKWLDGFWKALRQYISDVEEKLVQPISFFIKNDLKEFKEARRAFDKALEKYDNMLNRYTSQSKTKEASSLREDAFQLYEIRKIYIKVALDYTLKIIQFRAAADHLTMEMVCISLP
ncbi:10740_t:CDS:2 [Acaulospora colombiana]|uniref:10740_t:CDS:1 n=1 Tax=Acaulospora colombiana TaxID=27376 RepID=A0ACA9JXG1_9GLOM|nr:10740_t:CDS:2 [Acaulospora colombiana]